MAYDLTRFNQFVAEGRIVRSRWESYDDDGRETACLIGAIEHGMRPHKCPADLMPQWLAELTVSFNDWGSLEEWPNMVRRYAAAANRWHVLSAAAWRRCLLRTLRAGLEILLPHDSERPCANVIALIDREIAEDIPTRDEWKAAVQAAVQAAVRAMQAARASSQAARASSQAARAAQVSRASSQAAEAEAVRLAVRSAVRTAAEAEGAEGAEDRSEKAWDRITDACLSAIEAEIAATEEA